ncbi:MAG: thioesterase family protein [Kofleriaceae bacterium]
MVADLRADTTVAAGAAGLALGDRWDFALPSGGVVMTAALRAAAAALDPAERLLSATATFLEPVRPGPVTLAPTVLRRGASASQVRVALTAADSRGCEVAATFARDRPGPDVRGAACPDVPGPAACPDLTGADSPLGRLRFFTNFDVRLAGGTPLWGPTFAAGPARYLRWFRYRVPQRDGALLDRLALPPIVDTMPAALTRAIGPGPYRYYAPSVDLTLHVIDDTDREWLLVDVAVPRARAGWATGRAEVWDDQGRLIATACQTMYLRTLAGPAPVVDATTP